MTHTRTHLASIPTVATMEKCALVQEQLGAKPGQLTEMHKTIDNKNYSNEPKLTQQEDLIEDIIVLYQCKYLTIPQHFKAAATIV